jgi:hypothetical protein
MRRIPGVGVFAAAILLFGGMSGFPQQYSTTDIAGGRGGNAYSDYPPATGTRVAEVRIRAGDTIDAVQMVYSLTNGSTVVASQHGGMGGRPAVFSLDADEYIIGLAGRYGDTVDSLRIVTNKRTSQTFGGRGGDRDFRFDIPAGSQAIGFIGRAGDTVDAIGLAYAPLPRQRSVYAADETTSGLNNQTQLAGGRGGTPYADQQIASGARIAEVIVRAGNTITGIQAIYVLPDGSYVDGTQHGSSGGRSYRFRLDADEYITGLAGRYGDTVDSLRIVTNKRTSQTFGGGGGGRDFRLDVPSGNQATGFVGRAGDTVDAIGLMHTSLSRNRNIFSTGQTNSGLSNQTQLAGGRGGTSYVDQEIASGARIAEVIVRAGNTVTGIQAIYVQPDGSYVDGTQHGSSGGRSYRFRLDADEYITGLAGRYGDTIDSLRIVTNKRTSQTFGGGGGSRDFRLDVPSGNQAFGFASRAGNTVNAIGLVYRRMGSYRR